MATALKLYDATDALLDVRVWIEEHVDEIIAAGGELPPALQELADLADEQFETKVQNVGLYIRELVASAKAAKEEKDRLAQRQKHYDNAADAMKRYVQRELYRADVKAVKGSLCTVRMQRNSKPSVEVTGNPADLPEPFRTEIPPQPPVPYYSANTEALLAHWHEYFGDGQRIAQRRQLSMELTNHYAHAYADAHLPDGVTITWGSHVRVA